MNRYLEAAFSTNISDGTFHSDGELFSSLCTNEVVDGYQGRILSLQDLTDWHVEAHFKRFLMSSAERRCVTLATFRISMAS